MSSNDLKQLPIGIFDSGMGGLTVLKSLKKVLPQESFLYLGDTARLPYGTKSPATIIQYALQMVQVLLRYHVKCIVIACNTATMAALTHLQQQFPEMPIIGVIEPGVRALLAATRTQRVAVLATEATVQSQIYQRSLQQVNPQLQVTAIACSLFVALAEEGCTDDAIAKAAIEKYLKPLQISPRCDAVLLGCTHFPVLQTAIKSFLEEDIAIVNSAHTTATAVANLLQEKKLLATQAQSTINFLVTDSPTRFCRVGELFYGAPISAQEVDLVDTH